MNLQLSSAAVTTATLRAVPLPLAEASLSRALPGLWSGFPG